MTEVGPKGAEQLSYPDFHRVMLSGALSKVSNLFSAPRLSSAWTQHMTRVCTPVGHRGIRSYQVPADIADN